MSHSPKGRRLSFKLLSTSSLQSRARSRRELLALMIAGFILLQPIALMAQKGRTVETKTAASNSPNKGVSKPAPQAALTSGNLVVYRMGDGSAALSSNGTAVFLDEYTTAGALVQSIAVPTTTVGAQHRAVSSGTATSEGWLTRSADGQYLLFPGYDAAVGTASITGSSYARHATGRGTSGSPSIGFGRHRSDGQRDSS